MRLCQREHALVCDLLGIVPAAQAEQARADEDGGIANSHGKIVFPGLTNEKAVFFLSLYHSEGLLENDANKNTV
jgi:hypothetical protein